MRDRDNESEQIDNSRGALAGKMEPAGRGARWSGGGEGWGGWSVAKRRLVRCWDVDKTVASRVAPKRRERRVERSGWRSSLIMEGEAELTARQAMTRRSHSTVPLQIQMKPGLYSFLNLDKPQHTSPPGH